MIIAFSRGAGVGPIAFGTSSCRPLDPLSFERACDILVRVRTVSQASRYGMDKGRSCMRIVHVSTYNNVGGAGRAAYRLHEGLRRRGVNSAFLAAWPDTEGPGVHVYAPSSGLLPSIRRFIVRRRLRSSMARYVGFRATDDVLFTDDRTEHGAGPLADMQTADLWHLHHIAGFIDCSSLCRAAESTPIVWTLHDMNPMTGGCHYDLGCGKFAERCGACPRLGSNTEHDLSREIWLRKKKSLRRLDPKAMHVVCPSRWLAQEARRSSLLGHFPISVIPYGLDINVFSPRDRQAARSLLGIPESAEAIAFVASSSQRRIKGFPLLDEALAGLKGEKNLLLLSVGEGEPELSSDIRHVHAGKVNNDLFLAAIYSAADVFVIPSLQDNLPCTVLESMACGVPVVGFAVGGIPEMIREGETGLLAPPEDIPALRACLVRLLGDAALRARMSRVCRQRAMTEYSLEAQADRYAALYREALSGNAVESRPD